MRSWISSRRGAQIGICLVLALAVALTVVLIPASTRATSPYKVSAAETDTQITVATVPAGSPVETVGGPLRVRPVAPGFLGLSIEYYAVEEYAGSDPTAIDPVFLQLIRNLDPDQSPVLRIGGDSADWAWVPTAGLTRPAGVRVTITPDLIHVLAAIGQDLDARFILGLDLEADDVALTRDEARALVQAIGRSHVDALEVGNEPELYNVLPWYTSDGESVYGRSSGYDLADYEQEYERFGQQLPSVPLAAPASGSAQWSGSLWNFAATAPRLGIVTIHRYPLQACQREPGTPDYPTIAQLLSPESSIGLADSIVPQAAAAHAHGKEIRVDEINSVACFGADGVSNTFASSLWALETAFAMARVGVDGLNFHTLPGAVYGLFSFRRHDGQWAGHVAPDYYGLLTFAQAAPPRAKLLATDVEQSGLQTYATETRSGTIHVVVINPASASRTIGLRVPAATGLADIEYLRAPSVSSKSVSLDGETFGATTTTGVLTSPRRIIAIRAIHGTYGVRLPGPSAALLTLDAR